ncbi:chromate efflux transporter [Ensifer soli]|uniref:chromate efflux transporter n=1 Tax=Ciceribacter sp. sgz301302 TaxID=3342379 RepID=UPI0035B92717
MSSPPVQTIRPEGTTGEVFRAFLKLGLTSFGGPIAHLGYFRDELVTRRRWIDDAGYADLVALCQFLPGPASSQVGFALGLLRAGLPGALAAWSAFTLPSAMLLVLFAAATRLAGGPLLTGAVHGLKLVAVAVVAQAVFGMARSLAPDRQRAGIALGALLAAIFISGAIGQLGAILAGAAAGLVLCRDQAHLPRAVGPTFPLPRRAGAACLALFLVLLLVMPVLTAVTGAPALSLFDAFYRAGALVFGGGHVVLPLLDEAMVGSGRVTAEAFVSGYGAAQAVPGPLFTFAAYLGAVSGSAPNGIAGAAIALVAIFLPGLLLVAGALPFWNRLRDGRATPAAMRGANAAVVGILAAALYDPVFTSAVGSTADFALAATGFVLLTAWATPPFVVVLLGVAGGIAMTLA